MTHLHIASDLSYRTITRGEDTDYFIETDNYPIDLLATVPPLSRIQFPTSRAILVRTSPHTPYVTIHILCDTDLYSSIANFELDLTIYQFFIQHEGSYITLTLQGDTQCTQP